MSASAPTAATAEAPAIEYARRLEARRATAARLADIERHISRARLLVFAAAIALAWYALDAKGCSPWWLAVPVLAFAALAIVHERVIARRAAADRAAAFYEHGMARVEDRWMGIGDAGEAFLDGSHPYAADLDIFGHGSLFQLLCTARTSGGAATLAAWLRAPAPPAAIGARHAAVTELRPQLDFREEVALLGGAVRAVFDSEALTGWAAAPPALASRWSRIAAAALAGATVAAALAWALGAGLLPLLAALAAEGAFALPLRRRVHDTVRAVERPGRELALLAELLARLERERFAAPLLVSLRAALDADGQPPSRQIDRLRRRIELLDARRNQLFAPIAPLLLWTTQVAMALEAWRAACGPAVARWLSAVGEIEALDALAGYAYEHPRDPFPEIAATGPLFEAAALGHPLLPQRRCVRNDVRLGADARALIVSGSNMSGKSTLLRTVGTNAVLAFAGAPVRAGRLRLSPLAVGASIRINDSLHAGTSRFFAEITRLRQIVDLTDGAVPALFLLDEILHGTNSHDRRIGAEAVVRGLVERGAVGLVTTHDLALARIADALAPAVANVHFEDHLEDGRITFDYRMRPGVVEKSNALALMRSVGLSV